MKMMLLNLTQADRYAIVNWNLAHPSLLDTPKVSPPSPLPPPSYI
ncbi:MAG: hypothetical protein ACJ71K_01915 [Nitrososphaeraceae archaeon]